VHELFRSLVFRQSAANDVLCTPVEEVVWMWSIEVVESNIKIARIRQRTLEERRPSRGSASDHDKEPTMPIHSSNNINVGRIAEHA
jgi:hypothetical protein